MNPTVILLAATWLSCSIRMLQAEDWKTTDGKVYQDVQVVHAEPDAVTILHKDGGALVPLDHLPPDLKARFHYDPAQARAAAEARSRADAENAQALQAEMDRAEQMRQADSDAQGATPATTSAPPEEHDPLSDASASSDSSHHSTDELATSAAPMRRDLAEPDYHTMAHLASTMHSLAPDTSDPNHHSISEITDAGL